MSTNYLAARSSNLSTFNAISINYSTLTGGTIIGSTISNISSINASTIVDNTMITNQVYYSTMTGSTIATTTLSGNTIATPSLLLTSTVISLGQSTNSVYTRMSQGNAISTSSWVASLSTMSTATVSMSANAQMQLVVSQVSTTTSVQFTSTLGATWSALSNATGLPSATTTVYSAGAISGDGRYGVLGTTNGQLFVTANAGQSFSGLNTASPTIYLPLDTVPANGSSSSGTSPATLTVAGPPTQAPSYVMGTGAVNFANPLGLTATQYIRIAWPLPTNFTWTFWFNTSGNGMQQDIITATSGGLSVVLTADNKLFAYSLGNLAQTTFTIVPNTWYNVTYIYQLNATGYFYVNNQLIGSFLCTNPGVSSGFVTLGSNDGMGYYSAFRGYIDDFKIYNSAIPFTNLFPPQRFTNVAVSNSGQYMLATMANQGLYLSSNYGTTFSPITGAMLSALWSGAQVSATGQYMLASSQTVIVQPQLSELTTSSWQVNGITWTASASTVPVPAYNAFITPIASPGWNCSAGLYSGTYLGSVTTNVIGIGATGGEYLQLQSSVPVVLYSYNIQVAVPANALKTYVIAGSNDGITWYAIQSATRDTNPYTANFQLSSSMSFANYTGTQSIVAGNTTSVGTISYSTSANPYTYFRAIATVLFTSGVGTGVFFGTGQWTMNFQAGGQTYSTNYGATWNNGYALYSVQTQTLVYSDLTVSPQLTGLTGDTTTATVVQTTWVQNGISWTSNASNTIFAAGYQPWVAFNNVGNSSVTPYSWASLTIYPTPTSITNISSPGPGNYTGEWLQIYSSVPLVMYSYNFACGGANVNFPKEYFIVGSRDNSTWFPIQSVILSSNPFTANFVVATSPAIIVNSSASQTINGGAAVSFTPTIYSTTAQSYNYFRIIAKTNFGGGNFELNEWYVNFTPLSSIPATITYPSTTLSLSESGQYALSAIAPPLIAQLNFEGTFADSTGRNVVTAPTSGGTGSGVTLSSAQVKVGTQSLFVPNVAGAGTPLSYELYTLSSFFDGAPAYTISTWIYPTALPASTDSVPYILTDNISNVCGYPYINPAGNVGIAFYTTTSGTTAYGRLSTTTISVTTWSHIVVVFSSGTALLYINGVLAIPPITYTGTVSLYNNTGPPNRLLVGAGGFAYGGYAGYIDDLRIYNTALTSTQINTIYTIPLTTTVSGVAVSPQQTGLATSTWSQGGVNWTASASTIYTGQYAYNLFDNNYLYRWLPSSQTYTTSGNSSGIFTTINGIGSIQGDWVQLQTSVPLVMNSYQFAMGNFNYRMPKTYYIIGSNNGTDWSPIQFGSAAGTTTTTAYTLVPNIIIVNSAGTQTFGSTTITTTIYSTATTTAYLYFRLLCMTNNSPSPTVEFIDIGEWVINFSTAPNTSLYNVVSPITNFSTGSSVATGTIPGVITGSAISNTGQYMVVITNNTSGNNVYYSTNAGTTFTGLQLGTTPMTSCDISYDGSYITVSNATTVYTLNNNSSGYTVAIGNQAGQQNQAVNAIAIGNYAGYQNQTANSIILNATGSTINSVAQGFYVAPIASYNASSSSTFSLLGYGSDNQVVQTSAITMSSAGNIGFTANVGIGTTSPAATLDIVSPSNLFDGTAQLRVFNNSPTFGRAQITIIGRYENGNDGWDLTSGRTTLVFGYNTRQGGGISYVNAIQSFNGSLGLFSSSYSTGSPAMMITSNGFVGIRTTNPTSALHVNGAITSTMLSQYKYSFDNSSSTMNLTTTFGINVAGDNNSRFFLVSITDDWGGSARSDGSLFFLFIPNNNLGASSRFPIVTSALLNGADSTYSLAVTGYNTITIATGGWTSGVTITVVLTRLSI